MAVNGLSGQTNGSIALEMKLRGGGDRWPSLPNNIEMPPARGKAIPRKNRDRGTQWVHVSTAVNKAGWMLVDGSRIHQPDLVAFVGHLSGSCTAVNVSSWTRVLYALIFVAVDWFRTLLHEVMLCAPSNRRRPFSYHTENGGLRIFSCFVCFLVKKLAL